MHRGGVVQRVVNMVTGDENCSSSTRRERRRLMRMSDTARACHEPASVPPLNLMARKKIEARA